MPNIQIEMERKSYFITKNFNIDRLEEHFILLEGLYKIDKKKAIKFIENNKDILRRQWSDIVIIFRFLKEHYDKGTIKEYIKNNREHFTSSHLKNRLKNEGIFIQFIKGNLLVEVR